MVTGAMAASAIVGDHMDVNDKAIYPIVYKDVLVAEDSYQKPFDLKKRYVMNQDGFLEVWVGDERFFKVKKGLKVNDKSLESLLKEKGNIIWKRTKREGKRILMDFKEWYSGVLK